MSLLPYWRYLRRFLRNQAKDGEIGTLSTRLGDMGAVLNSVQAQNGELKGLLGTRDAEFGSLTK